MKLNREMRRKLMKQKVDLPAPTQEPRPQTEINQEYSKVCAESGALAYEIEAKKGQLAAYHRRISELASEGMERKRLDDERAAQESKGV